MRKIRWYSQNLKLDTWMMGSLSTILLILKIILSNNNINNSNKLRLHKAKTLTICNKKNKDGIAASMNHLRDGASVNVTPT